MESPRYRVRVVRHQVVALCLLVGLTTATGLTPATFAQSTDQLTDRILAVVDEDPILQSDLDRWVTLNPSLLAGSEDRRAADRRLLEDLIDQRLRSHEVERYGFGEVPERLVDEQIQAVEARYENAAALDAELDRVDWTRDDLRLRLRRQLAVLTYVDELLGARVFVGLEEIQEHYDRILVPELEAKELAVPELDDVREAIRTLLRQERLNEELDRWTEELRTKADIHNYFERPERPLPPTVTESE